MESIYSLNSFIRLKLPKEYETFMRSDSRNGDHFSVWMSSVTAMTSITHIGNTRFLVILMINLGRVYQIGSRYQAGSVKERISFSFYFNNV